MTANWKLSVNIATILCPFDKMRLLLYISTILSRNIYRMWPRVLGRWAQGLAIGAAMYQWCEFKSRRGKNTVGFNFQTYIYKNVFTSKKIASA
jgi:hypothetical protein